MAIAYLASSFDSNSSVDSSTTSWSYDSLATGSDRVLVVFPVYENNTSADVTAVTYNGVSLTFQETYVDDGGGFAETIECWTLVNPATGSNTLAFTLSETGRDFGFSAAVYTGVDQTTPVGNTAISAQYNSAIQVNADLLFAADSMGVYCSEQNRANTGPFTARTGNTQRGEYAVATGNSGFTACLGDRGPESSAATYNCGSDATTSSIGGGCVAIELLEASAGGAFTLTADSGTYTVTGTANSLLLDALLTGDSGSYAYTGTAADLTSGYGLQADSGSYSYTGTANALTRDGTLTAGSGAYTYTGTDATLTFASAGNFTLTALTGAYSVSGTNADLLRAATLGADSGSYSYTGTNAGFATGYGLTAESGAYSYTGTAVDFSQTYAIDAESGDYSYNGSAVSLVFTGLAPDIPAANGVVVSGTLGEGISFNATFGSGVTGAGSL